MMFNYISPSAEKLVVYIRDGLIEQEHYGYILRGNKTKILEKSGEDREYPFFLRSCAKPLQAALMIDYGLDREFGMTGEEIAVCCASHAGEEIHTGIVHNLLKKIGLSEKDLKCPAHAPISKTAQEKLLISGEKAGALHNNCSGKHTLMLGLCKLNGWDIKSYDDINHPLQQQIKKKIYSLCNVKHEYPVTKDGCGVPIFSMPLANILKGYLNLFCSPQYEKIKNAFLNYPYIIGGENRTDTKVISLANKSFANAEGIFEGGEIIAKVGACGLCVVVNTKLEEGFIVKICDSNMEAREFAVIDSINNLRWGQIECSHDIKTQTGDIVGIIKTLL